MTWSAGAVLTAAQLNLYAPQQWTTYAPTLTGFTVSSQEARYVRYGKTLILTYTGVLNAAVTGLMLVSLPIAANATAGPRLPIGTCMALDTGVTRRTGIVTLTSAGTIDFWSDATAASWGPTAPFTWASPDEFSFTCVYETT